METTTKRCKLQTSKLNDSQFNQYLSKMGIEKPISSLSPSFELLHELKIRHTTTFPFEALDVLLNKEIKMDILKHFEKLVLNKRGGFCYELNTLFACLLDRIGFDLDFRLGSVYQPGGFFSLTGYTHIVPIIHLNGKRFMVDVGFGDSPEDLFDIDKLMGGEVLFSRLGRKYKTTPILDTEDAQGKKSYILQRTKLGAPTPSKPEDEIWMNVYKFLEISCCDMCDEDVVSGLVRVQVMPNASFRLSFIISGGSENGRISIVGGKEITTCYKPFSSVSRELENAQDFLNTLAKIGIKLENEQQKAISQVFYSFFPNKQPNNS